MQQADPTQLCVTEVEEIFSGTAFGIDPTAWLEGRHNFLSSAIPLRATTRFSIGHYLFFGDPTLSLPALGYGLDRERDWVVKQVLLERNNLLNEPIGIYARRWRQRAGECIPITLEAVSTQQLKASIVACCAYAASPPSYEDRQKLQRLIDQLRKELTRRITGPKRRTETTVTTTVGANKNN